MTHLIASLFAINLYDMGRDNIMQLQRSLAGLADMVFYLFI